VDGPKAYLTLDETRKNLDSISPTYCAAKWTQALFQLHLGKLHNCCLTPAQQIDKTNFFESKQLVEERQEFLAGKKIKECGVCWVAEEKGLVSDRLSKSSDPSAISLYQSESRFQSKGIVPSYIELSLSNRCQFRCAYCSPENSSSLYKEMKEFGPYRTTDDFGQGEYLIRGDNFFLETDDNPYLDSFINWFPEISGQVKVLRFTGGEPLLSHKLYDLLDLFIVHPAPELELIFNSNLGVQPKILEQFLENLKKLPIGSYRNVTFVTSIDGWGKGAELARFGLSLELFEANYLKIREELPEAEIRFTCTVNILAFPDLKPLLVKVLEWKKTQKYSDQILITAYPLHYPSFLSLAWCMPRFEEEIGKVLSFIDDNFSGEGNEIGFKKVEKDMLFKALSLENNSPEEKQKNLIDFTLFMLQHKHRKNWSLDMLPKDVRDLLDEGILNLKENLEQNRLDSLTALKAFLWVDGPVIQVRDLLSHDMKYSNLNPWKVLDILNGHMKTLNYDWFFWWLKENQPGVATTMVSLLSPERQKEFFGYLAKLLMGPDNSLWLEVSLCRELIKLIPDETLRSLSIFSSRPFSSGQKAFWSVVSLKKPEFKHE
jgi:hypothetical protein